MAPIRPDDGAECVAGGRGRVPDSEVDVELLLLAGFPEHQHRRRDRHVHPLGLPDDGDPVRPRRADVLEPAADHGGGAGAQTVGSDGRVVEVVEAHVGARAHEGPLVEVLHGRRVVPERAEEVEVVDDGHVVDEPRVQRAAREDVAGAVAERRRRSVGRVLDRLPLHVQLRRCSQLPYR